jgi:hypothetical protein
MPTGPSAGGTSTNIVEKLGTAPVPKLASPCEFGPNSRMPAARAASTIARSCARAAGSGVSPKPELKTTQTRTPAPAQPSTASTASAPGTATIASSGTSGRAASDGYARSPWISSRVGLTG